MKNALLTYRDCPICGSTDRQSLCQIRLAPVMYENLPLHFHIVRCRRCGFCFDNMESCQNDFDKYYTNTIKYQHPDTWGSGNLSKADCERYNRVFIPCKKYIQDKSYLLDIGAGKGGLLRYIARERIYTLLNHICI